MSRESRLSHREIAQELDISENTVKNQVNKALVFHVDIRYAIGAALLASIANSSGAASAYVKEGITNIRLGMFLELSS